MLKTRQPLLATLTVALFGLSAAGAFAASPSAEQVRSMESRARAHIEAFPGFSLHGQGHSYTSTDALLDVDGGQHTRFERRYNGMRVVGGDLVVHADRAGNFRQTTQTMTRPINVARSARVGTVGALRAALAAHPGDPRGSQPELLVYARGDLPVLAYDVRLFGDKADGTPMEKHVIVDGQTGAVLDAWDDVHTAAASGTGTSLYSGAVSIGTNSVAGGYELRDTGRGNSYATDMRSRTTGGTVFTDTDNAWGNGTTASTQSAAVDAQYGFAVTWDYYKNVHGRSGIANNGAGTYSRVHYGSRYNNAFWSDSCFCMTYGDGDGSSFTPLVSLDVAGHEMTHGVTSRTARLIYSGESGGLNEGTSDIFGTMVEFYAANTADAGDYLIGEKITKFSPGYLRSMVNPSVDGGSADCWYSGVGNLDVHYSSGVANHFYYLLAMGTTAGSPSKTCAAGNTRVATGLGTVPGVGRSKAEKIWYRALTVYMTSSTNYANARTATTQAAGDLYGSGSTEVQAVAAAWTAVGRP